MIGGGGRVGFRDIVALAQQLRRDRRSGAAPGARAQLHAARSSSSGSGWRARSRKDQGLGPEASVLKLAASRRLELDGNLVLALQGAPAMLYDGDAVQRRLLAAAVPRCSGAAASAAAPSRSSAT